MDPLLIFFAVLDSATHALCYEKVATNFTAYYDARRLTMSEATAARLYNSAPDQPLCGPNQTYRDWLDLRCNAVQFVYSRPCAATQLCVRMTLASFIKDDVETLDTFKRGLARQPDLSGVTDGSHAPNMFLETRVHKALLAHIERQGITPSFHPAAEWRFPLVHQ